MASDSQSRPRKKTCSQLLRPSHPCNISHRGSSGMYPKETAMAYLLQKAIDEGADFLEADILLTKDENHPVLQFLLPRFIDDYLSISTSKAQAANFLLKTQKRI